MLDHHPRITRGAVRCALYGIGYPSHPEDAKSARLVGMMESWLLDLNTEGQEAFRVHYLESALTSYFVERAGEGFVSVDFQRLARLVGSEEVCRIALLRSGIWPRKSTPGARTEWSDKPQDRAARSTFISFFDVLWDGAEFIPRKITVAE